jgi:hypothetical protein
VTWIDIDDLPPEGWTGRPTLKQAQSLHISAKAAGLGKGDLAKHLWMAFGKFSTKDLDWNEYLKTQSWLESAAETGGTE